MQQLIPFGGHRPQLDPSVFVAPGVLLVGNVTAGEGSSFWYNTVVRADVQRVEVGRFSNIQDGTIIHEDSGRGTGNPNGSPTLIGDYVTVGHNVILHACILEDYSLIGMGAIIMDEAVIGKGSVVGAGALVTKGTRIPPFSLVLGAPAKAVRTLDPATIADRKEQAIHYSRLAQEHRAEIEGGQAPHGD